MTSKTQKIGRSIRLTPEINQRLLELCAHLGTTPNAYLVSEIGKCVARDELTYQIKNQAADLFEKLEEQMSAEDT